MSVGTPGVGTIVAAVVLAAGIATAGWFAGQGVARFKGDVRTVTVKGLVERDVQSDQALWTLSFRRTGDSIAELHKRVAADREAVVRFLKARGFPDGEVEIQPALTTDRHAQDFGVGQEPRTRFVVASSVHVRGADVARVRGAFAATDELLQQGVVLDAATDRANPRYLFTRFNELRPQLLADATKNARATAQQFAGDSGAVVGGIRTANQGNIQIFGSDGNDESGPWSPTSTPAKRIRVVSTFEFELR